MTDIINIRNDDIINILICCEFVYHVEFGFIVRSLSGKKWPDRDKADKVSISFSATPKMN